MTADKTQEANPDQLLKLLELQVAEARARRAQRESGRSRAGTAGLVLILGGAAAALWILMMLLDQMKPEHARRESASAQATERAR